MWDPTTGKPFTDAEVKKIIDASAPYWCEGLSILGGEPTAPWNIKSATELARLFKQAYPQKTVWAWSGRLKSEIEKLEGGEDFLASIDVLIDGPFIQERKDISLKWRGSSNQRLWRKVCGEWMLEDPMM